MRRTALKGKDKETAFVNLDELRLIESVLAFASLPPGFAPRAVYGLADPWAPNGRAMRMNEATEQRRFPKDQRALRVRLTRLLLTPDTRDERPYVTPPTVARWAAKKAREGMFARYDARVVEGHVQLRSIPVTMGVEAWEALALLFLLDDERPFRAGLRLCARCSQKWFLAVGIGEGRKKFCDGCREPNRLEKGRRRAKDHRSRRILEEVRQEERVRSTRVPRERRK